MRDRVGHGVKPPVNAPTHRCIRLTFAVSKTTLVKAGQLSALPRII